ncbi:MAG: response regulator [Acidobacteria bacterium]|nr:MAG: response regulator [Acidobacteriota bacterium]
MVPRAWRAGFRAGVVVSAVLWSSATFLYVSGRGFGEVSCLLLVATGGLCAGGINTVAPSLPLSRLFVTILLAPLTALPLVRPSRESAALAAMVAIYLGFLWVQSGLTSRAYWSNLRARMLLEERARQLEQARAEAEQACRARGRFLANMSHEIRTPMNAVLGMTSLVLETDLTDEQREYLEIARDSGRALLTLINDILDFSKIEAGKLVLERIPFDPAGLARSTIRTFQIRNARPDLAIELSLDPDLPPRVMGDPGRLRQVLVNLLGNAVKFTPRGRVTLRVEREAGDPPRLRFEVRDTGIGFDESMRERIFDAFVQGDASTTRRYGGTGLGLAISAQLVAMMGGRLDARSRPGHGSSFFFSLPCEEPAVQADEPAARDLPHPEPARVPRRVLVAEDNRVNQMLVTRALSRRGHRVELAANGQEAVELFARNRYDIVLMDLQMPEMDGFAAAAAIRSLERGSGRHTPIVALTAHAMAGDEKRCLEAGMDAYLAKPFDIERLARLVDELTAATPAPAPAL